MADGSITIDVDVNGDSLNGLNSDLASVEGNGEKASLSIGKIVTALGLVKLASAAFGALKDGIGASLNEGAALQQSLGGIETLFKDSGDKVKAYADEAYKTAGMSANSYMETVTSFSASLLQSMGGDTEAAADTANMALIDMSDNANKMGTSMESIQDAYKGFAKQNYTMLDNLSLGYGGTKTEMERLLADATKLSGVEYNIDNLDDVYNAIHAVQEEMGITGTTAKESAETFSGSLDSMKASFSNVLGKLALGQDIKPSLEALAQTTATFLMGNFFPMIGNIFKALPGALSTLIKASIPYVKDAFSEMLDAIVTKFPILDKLIAPLSQMITAVKALIKGFKAIFSSDWSVNVIKLHEQFTNVFPESLWKGMTKLAHSLKDLMKGFKSGSDSADSLGVVFKLLKVVLLGMLGPVGIAIKAFELIAKSLGGGDVKKGIGTIMQSFEGLTKNIQSNGPTLGKSFGQALEGILGAIAKALPGIVSGALQVVAGFISGIAKGLPMLTVAAFQFITAFTGAMLVLIPTVVLSATAIIVAFLGALTTALPRIIEAGGKLINAILQGITEQLPALITSAASLIVTWLTALNEHMPEILQAGFNLLITFLQGIALNIGSITNQAISIVVNFAQAIVARMPDIVNAAVNLIVSFVNGLASRMPDIISSAATLIASFINGIANNLGQIIAAAVNLIVKFIEGITKSIPAIVNAAMGLIDAMVSGLLQAQDRLFKAVTTLINGMADNIRNNEAAVREAALNLLNAIVGVFVPDALLDAGEAIIKGFLKGLKAGFEEVKTFVGGIATWIKENKGPISYDRKLLITNGMSIMQGLDKGLQDSFKNVQSTVSVMADKLNRNMNLDWQLGANSSALPKISAESALGISSRMATNTSDIHTTNITNNSNNDNGFKELANAVREFTEKPLVTNINGRKMSDELGPTNDATQIQRTKFSGWGLEIQ
ncbi:phage tail protein [Carnobacterium maltaromaticum]